MTGTWLDYFVPYIGNNNLNWPTPSFFRGVGQPRNMCRTNQQEGIQRGKLRMDPTGHHGDGHAHRKIVMSPHMHWTSPCTLFCGFAGVVLRLPFFWATFEEETNELKAQRFLENVLRGDLPKKASYWKNCFLWAPKSIQKSYKLVASA